MPLPEWETGDALVVCAAAVPDPAPFAPFWTPGRGRWHEESTKALVKKFEDLHNNPGENAVTFTFPQEGASACEDAMKAVVLLDAGTKKVYLVSPFACALVKF